MKKYYGYFSANNRSTYTREPYEFGNLKEACKDMKEMCEGNVFAGNNGSWWVDDESSNTIREGDVQM